MGGRTFCPRRERTKVEKRAEFVAAVKDRIDVAIECTALLRYPLDLAAFSIILEYLIQDLDCVPQGSQEPAEPVP